MYLLRAASSLYLKAMLTGQVGSKTRDLSQAKVREGHADP